MQTAPIRLRLNNIADAAHTKFNVEPRINLGMISIRSIPSRKNYIHQLHQVESGTIAGKGVAKKGMGVYYIVYY